MDRDNVEMVDIPERIKLLVEFMYSIFMRYLCVLCRSFFPLITTHQPPPTSLHLRPTRLSSSYTLQAFRDEVMTHSFSLSFFKSSLCLSHLPPPFPSRLSLSIYFFFFNLLFFFLSRDIHINFCAVGQRVRFLLLLPITSTGYFQPRFNQEKGWGCERTVEDKVSLLFILPFEL